MKKLFYLHNSKNSNVGGEYFGRQWNLKKALLRELLLLSSH